MIEYISTTYCRSKTISKYFGEADAKECGVCDNCLAKKQLNISTEEFEKISVTIMQQLSECNLTMDTLLEKIKVKKEKLWKVVEFLQAEKKIAADVKGVLKIQ